MDDGLKAFQVVAQFTRSASLALVFHALTVFGRSTAGTSAGVSDALVRAQRGSMAVFVESCVARVA